MVRPSHFVRFATTIINFEFKYDGSSCEAALATSNKAVILRVEWLLGSPAGFSNFIDLESEKVGLQEQDCDGIFSHEGIILTGEGQTLSVRARMCSGLEIDYAGIVK